MSDSKSLVDLQRLMEIEADFNEETENNGTQLHIACIRLQRFEIESLLKNKTDVNGNDIHGATPLHYAVLYQTLPKKAISLLAKLTDNWSKQGTDQWLHGEGLFIHLGLMSEFHITGFGRKMVNRDQLHYIKYCLLVSNDELPVPPGEAEHVTVVTALLESGANPSVRDLNGRTPLHIVACLGYDKIAEVLLKGNSDPNAKDLYGVTPLREAVDNSHHAIVDLLLRNSAMVNAVDVLGESIMHAAVRQNNWPAVKSCMRYGAMVDIQNMHGNTPLHVVQSSTFRHMTYYLVKYGKANLNIRNWLGHTVLHDAVLRGQTAANFVEYLCKLGADPNIADNYGNTCLHDVAGFAIGNILICYAEDVNAKNKQGLTPLHFACRSSKPDSVWISRLLKEGAEVNACDGRGATPLHYLAKHANGEQHLTIFELFDMFNADFNIQTRGNKKTPLHLLCENSDTTNSLFDFVYSKSNPLMADSLGRTWAHCIAESTGSWQSRFSVVNERSKDVHGWTPCFIRISTQLDKMQALLENENINDTDNFGRTMLSLCFDSSLQNLVTLDENFPKLLELALYKDFMDRNFLHHWSMVDPCRLHIDSTVLKTLFGEHINERDKFGRTPLYYAALHWSELLEKLLEAGADPTIGDNLGVLPFEVADSHLTSAPFLKPENSSNSTKVVQMRQIHRNFNPFRTGSGFRDVTKKWENFERIKPPTEYDNFNTDCVTIFVQTVMSEVAKIDSRFESSQTLVGSAHQGTRASFPGDYDFLIIMDAKDVQWQADESPQFQGDIKLTTQNRSFDEFVNENRILQPDLLKDKLYCLLTKVLYHPDVWKAGFFEPLRVRIDHELKSPAITLKLFQNPLLHNDKVIVSRQQISVDFVLAIRTEIQLPEDTPFSQFLLQNDYGSVDRSAYAIMKSPKYLCGGEQTGLCSITFSLVESEIIYRSSAVIKAAYMLLVGLIPLRCAVHKYMLTTCLLSCIVHGELNDFLGSNEMDGTFDCLKVIFRYVMKAMVNDAVESIICPGRILPVWQFEPSAKFIELYVKRFGLSYVSNFKYNRPETNAEIRRSKKIASLISNLTNQMRHVFSHADNVTIETICRFERGCRLLRDDLRRLTEFSEEEFDEWIDELTEARSSVDSTGVDLNRYDKMSVMYDYELGEVFCDKATTVCYTESPFAVHALD